MSVYKVGDFKAEGRRQKAESRKALANFALNFASFALKKKSAKIRLIRKIRVAINLCKSIQSVSSVF